MSKNPFEFKFYQFSVLQHINATFLSWDRQSSMEDLDVYLYIQVWLRCYKLPNEDQAMSLQRLIWSQMPRRKLCKDTKAPTASMWGKKRRQLFLFIPKTQYCYNALDAMGSWQTYLCESVWMAVLKSRMMMTWNCSGLWFWWWEKARQCRVLE